MRVVNPEPDPRNKTEVPTPDNVLYCGALNYLQKYDIVYSSFTAFAVESFDNINFSNTAGHQRPLLLQQYHQAMDAQNCFCCFSQHSLLSYLDCFDLLTLG